MSGHLDPFIFEEAAPAGPALTPFTAVDNVLVFGGEAFASAFVAFTYDGLCYYTSALFGTVFRDGEWYNPETPGIAEEYQIMATLVSGEAPMDSPLDTWLDIFDDVQWTLTAHQTFPGSDSAEGVIAVSIRRVSDLVVVVDSVEITIQAFAEYA